MKYMIFVFITTLSLLISCNNELRCERHFIPKGFMGKVTIYFNKETGQKEFDKEGCIVYRISEKGECLSALPFKEGIANPHKTYRFFEVIDKYNVKEIPEFDVSEYLQDSINNARRKYVFFTASGYENPTGSNPNYVLEYYVDYGRNYKNY